jgi:RNA polymerase sigma factor (sigma-70 family)
MPPPAEGFAARLVLGPALRTQPDRRLVALVREGYENAFEEIVRRYGRALTRYAAAIVGSRGEDVTQDAFSKALLALRRNEAEIELRPWLFRIVRNTALNDLRDSPPTPELLAEAIAGGDSPAEALERREELADLMRRLQSLPEPQRAAIVMREMEGLSHEEIAATLGVSGGAARQAIHRARQTLRNGAGMLIPLPLLKALLAAGSMGTTEVAVGAGGTVGAGVALKAATATVLVVGAVGAGVAVQDGPHPGHSQEPRPASASGREAGTRSTTAAAAIVDDRSGSGDGDRRGRSESEPGDHRGKGREPGDDHRGRQAEPGDDRGDRGEEPGDDRTNGGPETGEDHGGRGSRSGSGGDGGGSGSSGGGGDRGPSQGGTSGHGGSSGSSGGSGQGGGGIDDDLAAAGGGGSSGGPGPSGEQQPAPEESDGGGSGPSGESGSGEGSESGGSSGGSSGGDHIDG